MYFYGACVNFLDIIFVFYAAAILGFDALFDLLGVIQYFCCIIGVNIRLIIKTISCFFFVEMNDFTIRANGFFISRYKLQSDGFYCSNYGKFSRSFVIW